jgi:hypothetical protein
MSDVIGILPSIFFDANFLRGNRSSRCQTDTGCALASPARTVVRDNVWTQDFTNFSRHFFAFERAVKFIFEVGRVGHRPTERIDCISTLV